MRRKTLLALAVHKSSHFSVFLCVLVSIVMQFPAVLATGSGQSTKAKTRSVEMAECTMNISKQLKEYILENEKIIENLLKNIDSIERDYDQYILSRFICIYLEKLKCVLKTYSNGTLETYKNICKSIPKLQKPLYKQSCFIQNKELGLLFQMRARDEYFLNKIKYYSGVLASLNLKFDDKGSDLLKIISESRDNHEKEIDSLKKTLKTNEIDLGKDQELHYMEECQRVNIALYNLIAINHELIKLRQKVNFLTLSMTKELLIKEKKELLEDM